jgi:hypothetical protein
MLIVGEKLRERNTGLENKSFSQPNLIFIIADDTSSTKGKYNAQHA